MAGAFLIIYLYSTSMYGGGPAMVVQPMPDLGVCNAVGSEAAKLGQEIGSSRILRWKCVKGAAQ